MASRWGDYSSAVPDPVDPRGFYISNEIGITPEGCRIGGQITATEVTQDEIAYRVTREFDDYAPVLNAAIADTDPEAKPQAPAREDLKRAGRKV